MAFTDNFTAASDTNLENHTPSGGTAWTLRSGSAGSAKINAASGTLRTNLAPDAAYICDNQGSADNYVQAVFVTLGQFSNSIVATRFVDASNFIGWRCAGTGASGLRLTKNVAGTLTDLYSMQGVAGNTYKVEVTGSVAILYENGTNKSGNQTYSENTTETAIGLRTSDAIASNWIDDFEAGTVGGAATYTVTPSGGMAFAGAAPYARGRVFSVAGGLAFSGANLLAKGKVLAMTGGLVLGGIASYLRGKILTSSGGLQFSGTTPIKRNWLTVSGGLAFAGAVAMQFTSISAPVIRELLRLSDRVFGRRSLKQRKF